MNPIGPFKLRELRALDWFQQGYAACSPECGIGKFNSPFDGQEILAFIGTWCGDCHEQLPPFVRILEEVGFPLERLSIYALDRGKSFGEGPFAKSGAELLKRWGIHRLPTLIFLRDGEELGRIVESPQSPDGKLHEDMRRIWSTQ